MAIDKDARIAEFERRLAEQRAFILTLLPQYGDIGTRDVEVSALRKTYENPEELNNLLAKAKEEGRGEAVPEGWQAVPKEATHEMIVAAMDRHDVEPSTGWGKIRIVADSEIYKAMLAAAPKPQGKTE